MTTNKATTLDWMMWFETQNPKGFPSQTLQEGVAYYAQKYGQRPNRAQFPTGTNLDDIGHAHPDLRLETDKMILARHIYLTYDPNENSHAADDH